MKKSSMGCCILLVAVWALVSGCADQSANMQHTSRPGEQPAATMVYQPPPPPHEQAPVRPPGPQYAYSWVPGYWTWQGQWVWANGTWIPRPRPHVEWVPGKWVKRGQRYIWIRGRWQ
jgi:hypothetical protein